MELRRGPKWANDLAIWSLGLCVVYALARGAWELARWLVGLVW